MRLPAFVDAHVHFRQGDALATIVPQSDRYCEFALVMPNTDPPISTLKESEIYKQQIMAHCKQMTPLMTLKLTPKTDPQQLNNITAVKLYPDGVTTNSENGFGRKELENIDGHLAECLDVMSMNDIPLCVHGEMPGEFCMDREDRFLEILADMIMKFPKLRIVLEHITTMESVSFVKAFYPRCAATITLHHLELTLDDVVGDKLRPHYFCKPIPKRPQDRNRLVRMALSGEPGFFLGSDSAPHLIGKKECDHGCAGVFTAPHLPENLVGLFVRLGGGNAERIANFTSLFARRWYRLPEPTWMLEVEEKKRKIDELIGDPFDGYLPYAYKTTIDYEISRHNAE
jgi:dihydroorotase